MAGEAAFGLGTRFHTFQEFQNQLADFETREGVRFVVRSTKAISRARGYEEFGHLKYYEAVYACRRVGRREPAVENEPYCPARIMIRAKKEHGQLEIQNFVQHNHG